MTPSPGVQAIRWWFSITLLLVYLAVFHLWLGLERAGILASGAVATVGLAVLFRRALVTGCFVNRWDAFAHAVVIGDLALEAGLVREHDDFGFYLCALGFAAVVGAYRAAVLGRSGAGSVAGSASRAQLPTSSAPAPVEARQTEPVTP